MQALLDLLAYSFMLVPFAFFWCCCGCEFCLEKPATIALTFGNNGSDPFDLVPICEGCDAYYSTTYFLRPATATSTQLFDPDGNEVPIDLSDGQPDTLYGSCCYYAEGECDEILILQGVLESGPTYKFRLYVLDWDGSAYRYTWDRLITGTGSDEKHHCTCKVDSSGTIFSSFGANTDYWQCVFSSGFVSVEYTLNPTADDC